MSTIVRLIALALVITHITGGCCLHHAHAEGSAASGHSPTRDDGCGHHRSPCEEGRESGEHSHHGDDSPCGEGDCNFFPGRFRSDERLISSDTSGMLFVGTLAPVLKVDAVRLELTPTTRGIPSAPLFIWHQAFLL